MASSISHSRVSSTSGSAGVVKDSGITVALSGASGLSWHRAMVCYGSKAWAALCTAAQMLAAILWIQVEAIINVFCYGNTVSPQCDYYYMLLLKIVFWCDTHLNSEAGYCNLVL